MDAGLKIVFYDGDCGVCNRFVGFILRFDTVKTLRFAALQGTTAKKMIAGPVSLETIVYFDGDCSHRFSTGVLLAVAEMGGAWRLTKTFLIVPRFFRDAVYRLFAKYRHRFSTSDHCRMPSDTEKARFLE